MSAVIAFACDALVSETTSTAYPISLQSASSDKDRAISQPPHAAPVAVHTAKLILQAKIPVVKQISGKLAGQPKMALQES